MDGATEILDGSKFSIETASATRSNAAGTAMVERDLYNFISVRKTGSVETDINCGSEAIVMGCIAGASVAAGADASVAAAPHAERNSPNSNITKKDFSDIKASFREINASQIRI